MWLVFVWRIVEKIYLIDAGLSTPFELAVFRSTPNFPGFSRKSSVRRAFDGISTSFNSILSLVFGKIQEYSRRTPEKWDFTDGTTARKEESLQFDRTKRFYLLLCNTFWSSATITTQLKSFDWKFRENFSEIENGTLPEQWIIVVDLETRPKRAGCVLPSKRKFQIPSKHSQSVLLVRSRPMTLKSFRIDVWREFYFVSHRCWTITRIHVMSDRWTNRTKPSALDWLEPQPAEMSWSCRSKWTRMEKLLTPNSRRSAAVRLLLRAHTRPNGSRARPSTRQASWRTLTLPRSCVCRQSSCIVRVSVPLVEHLGCIFIAIFPRSACRGCHQGRTGRLEGQKSEGRPEVSRRVLGGRDEVMRVFWSVLVDWLKFIVSLKNSIAFWTFGELK